MDHKESEMKNRIDNKEIQVSLLRNSPVHNLKALNDKPDWINIDDIEVDPTNPGSVTESLRYRRRTPSIRDSYDILGRIIYPIVVCKSLDNADKYVHVDGFGRLEQLRERGEKQILAYIYPPMTLEQRICFRQTLNAAQEPFDAVSIIQDLRTLSAERNLDLNNSDHVETLVRDLPEKVQKHKKDILELSRWHPEAIAALGESYDLNPKSIGIDQIRSLGRIMTEVLTRHKKTLVKLGGLEEFSKKLAQMYIDRRFAENGRSQDGIRVVVKSLKTLPEEDPAILEFFDDGKAISELEKVANSVNPNREGLVVEGCTSFINTLLNLNTKHLTEDEMNALKRTAVVLNSVFSEAGV